jgi:C1A family cysteine protease
MRKTAIVALLAIAGAAIMSFAHHKMQKNAPLSQVPGYVEEAFQTWMTTHSKVYSTPQELNYRRGVFLQNYFAVLNYNKRNLSFQTALNVFADLTLEEFKSKYTGLNVPQNKQKNVRSLESNGLTQVPSSVDWRTQGVVNPVKNQGQCGSCWAFSATGAIESANAIAGKGLLNLAEQQLVDCGSTTGNQGCNGGWMDWAFEYVISVGGQEATVNYPYTAQTGNCQFNSKLIAASISSFYDVPQSQCKQLQAAVATKPTSVAIQVLQSFQMYKSGVYSGVGCGTSLDHGVIIVGYQITNWTTAGQNWWIVRNSWGASWGENGYIRMDSTVQQPSGICGICTVASYPIV